MPPPTARSPFAGCTVMIVALLVMAFVLGFSIWSLFKLDSEIARFTSPEAKPVPLRELEGAEGELNTLKARLEEFRSDLGAEPPRPCRLALTPTDLNDAIAAFDELRDLRGALHVAGIDDGHMRIDICFPMNARPLSGESRFLNATLLARPELHPGEVVLRVDEIRVPGSEVPTEFLERFSPYRPLERYRDHPQLGPVMKRLTGIEVGDGAVVLRALPDESPPQTIDDEQVDAASSRLFGILAVGACGFLLVAGLFIVIGLRRTGSGKETDDLPRL